MTTTTTATTPATRPTTRRGRRRRRAAFATTVASTAAERSAWLRAVADALDGAADELVPLADEESHLGDGAPHAASSRARPRQLRLFAAAVVEGSYLEVTVDHPDPSTTPPRPDLRRMLRPLGPVAVFSASNFPFAFSVAGGDTASALAAGCPVDRQGRTRRTRGSRAAPPRSSPRRSPRRAPRTASSASSRAARPASRSCSTPRSAPSGFTGSLHGGRALFDLASSRPDPIPFYGELSAVNPVADHRRGARRARRRARAAASPASFTLGAGQFCTNPGVVFVPGGLRLRGARRRRRRTGRAPCPCSPTASPRPSPTGLAGLAAHDGVEVVAGEAAQQPGTGSAVVLSTTTAAVARRPRSAARRVLRPRRR